MRVISLLADAGADFYPKKGLRGAPLVEAVRGGHTPVVTLLLRLKADVDAHEESGGTALWSACMNGKSAMAEALIDARADLNFRCKLTDSTPLLAASSEGWRETTELLLKRRADMSIAGCRTDGRHPRTPLQIAYLRKRWQIVELLGGTAAAEVSSSCIVSCASPCSRSPSGLQEQQAANVSPPRLRPLELAVAPPRQICRAPQLAPRQVSEQDVAAAPLLWPVGPPGIQPLRAAWDSPPAWPSMQELVASLMDQDEIPREPPRRPRVSTFEAANLLGF